MGPRWPEGSWTAVVLYRFAGLPVALFSQFLVDLNPERVTF